jgi:hypothetical protein
LSDSEKSAIADLDAQTESFNDLHKATLENVEAVSSQFSHYEDLAKEYDSLRDSNGQVKQGEEERANFIVTTLAQAMGMEASDLQALIDKNGSLSASINDVIEKKNAEAMLNAYQDEYTNAIKEQKQALQDYVTIRDQYAQQQTVVNSAEQQYKSAVEAEAAAIKNNGSATQEQIDAVSRASAAYGVASGSLQTLSDKQSEAENKVNSYNVTIKNYEGVSAAIISGDTASIASSLDNLTNNFVTAENGTRTSLENQVTNLNTTYQQLDNAVKSGAPGVTQSMVDNARNMVDKANEELEKLPPEADENGTEAGNNFVGGISSATDDAWQAGYDNANAANNGQNSADNSSTGVNAGEGYASGVDSASGDSYSAGVDNANNANDGAGSVDATGTGQNFAAGFGNGMSSLGGWIWDTASGLAIDAYNAICDTLGIHSPSRVMKKIGGYFGEGFANGITDQYGNVEKTAAGMSKAAVGAISGTMIPVGLSASADMSSTVTVGRNQLADSVSNAITTSNQATKQTASAGSTVINMTINPPAGTDNNAIADLVQQKINNEVARRKAVFG